MNHNAAQRDYEDRMTDIASQAPIRYPLPYMIDAVCNYQKNEHCTIAQAIMALCEGHELCAEDEAALRGALLM
jgi:hypothetical protein